jgi:hypothetical protein
VVHVFGKLRSAAANEVGIVFLFEIAKKFKAISANGIIKFFRFTFAFDRTAITFGFVPAFRMKMTFLHDPQNGLLAVFHDKPECHNRTRIVTF